MKKFLLGLLAATTFTAPACASQSEAVAAANQANAAAARTAAAPLPDADPAMWVVKDEDTTVYLFGTFHLMDGKADWFNDEVRQAFDKSQEVVFEIVLPEDQAEMAAQFQPLMVRYAPDQKGRSLKDRLSADEYKKLYETLAPLGVPAGAFDPMEPWFASFMLTGAMAHNMGLSPEHGAEFVLKRAANERKLQLGQVETIEGQVQMFDSMPDDVQLTMLKEQLNNASAMNEMMPRMLAVWNSGNTQGLDEMMNEGLGDDPRLRRILLGARNEKWAEWIDQRLDKPGTVFMAVGAGHLVGPDSVQAFLAKRNIKSERVPALTPNR